MSSRPIRLFFDMQMRPWLRSRTIFNPYFQLPKYCLDDKLFSYFMKNVSSAPHWFDDERNQNNRKRRRWNVKKLSINKPDFFATKISGVSLFLVKNNFCCAIISEQKITFGMDSGLLSHGRTAISVYNENIEVWLDKHWCSVIWSPSLHLVNMSNCGIRRLLRYVTPRRSTKWVWRWWCQGSSGAQTWNKFNWPRRRLNVKSLFTPSWKKRVTKNLAGAIQGYHTLGIETGWTSRGRLWLT